MRYLLFLLLLAMPAQARAQTSAQAIPGVFGSQFRFTEQGGQLLYTSLCAGCHMQNGQGATGAASYPSLRENTHLAAAGYVTGVILRGQRAMPPLGRFLTDRQIADVATYIRQNFGNSYAEPVSETSISR